MISNYIRQYCHILTLYKSLCLFALVFFMSFDNVAADGSFKLKVNQNLVSLEASNASLLSIASELSELTGVPVNHTDGADQSVTISMTEEPLEVAVAKLHKNHVLVRSGTSSTDLIVEIILLLDDGGSSGTNASLPTGEPNQGVVSGDTVEMQVPEPETQPGIIEQPAQPGVSPEPSVPSDSTEPSG